MDKDPIKPMDRSVARLSRGNDPGNAYVDATPAERIAMVEQLTIEFYSIQDPDFAQRRLQRNVAKLIRP